MPLARPIRFRGGPLQPLEYLSKGEYQAVFYAIPSARHYTVVLCGGILTRVSAGYMVVEVGADPTTCRAERIYSPPSLPILCTPRNLVIARYRIDILYGVPGETRTLDHMIMAGTT